MKKPRIAFIGAGAVAGYHAYALNSLPHYYSGCPRLDLVAVSSATATAREAFAARHGFREALSTDELARRTDVDTVYILSPNALHYSHLQMVFAMPEVRRIYIEKPLCVTAEQARSIADDAARSTGAVRIQLGFQFLHTSGVRHAHLLWRKGELGEPIHFHVRYLHSGYLDAEYRARRAHRMKPAPEGGALVDLGSHAFSLAVAFLGDGLEVLEAAHSRALADVESDLCTVALCRDRTSGAVGTVMSSRVSVGAAECLELELRGTEKGFRFSTELPEALEILSSSNEVRRLTTASDFAPHSRFPKSEATGGWLRSLVHANYLFLSDIDEPPLADLQHGLTVQRLLHDTTRRIQAQP